MLISQYYGVGDWI